ncbi:S-layer homology domain-containing protein [Paenibacillus allorhizosphaerae]|uniref:S-layer homology domain-containing protein n=1 Tax=Paenibacillus allorhizosphaerae TaxID=2849866 RepID=A0ABM8VS39_9BACL|nr:S-layer homology domain-containing protein [Paenibacillus allorhizosphaerae]CAG7656051.1 hypothetical protein PAECIP111802_06283 [Paenibacillus allorhizosphaerae]
MSYKELRKKISSVLVSALLFGMLAPAMAFGAEAVKLKDITDSYAKTEIQALVDAGIVSGYEDGSFQPTKAMTRAELAKIIVLALGKKENPDKAASFADVDKNSWYRGYVGALVESGITDGTSATTFSPDAKVTREELVVFFVRAMGLEETAKKVAADAKLSDLAQVSSWAKAHVSLAFKMGFVQGIENNDGTLSFNPKANAERQALARLAYEFKTNKAKFVEKAQAIAKAEEKPSTGGSTGTGSTGGGGSYGGGGGYSGGGSNNASIADRLKAGETLTGNVTLGAGTFGPEDGKTAKIAGTLTLDPGATGTVTLKNIEADNIVVASGDSNSIHLINIKIKVKLTVNASTQTVSVRIVAEGTTTVAATEVTSKAIVENGTTNGAAFGAITIKPTASNQQVDLKGNISSAIKITGAVTLNVYGTVGTITAEEALTLNALADSNIGTIQLNSAKANVSISGSGIIQNIIAAVAGAVLNIADGNVKIQKLTLNVKITLQGDVEVIKNIPIVVPEGKDVSEFVDGAETILDAVKLSFAIATLQIGYADDENADGVKSNLTLPTSALNGDASVTWSSDNAAVNASNGEVTRPAVGQPDAAVTLTATVKVGTLEAKRTFKVTVKAKTDVVDPQLPGTVTGITYTSTTNSIILSWLPADNAVSYAVYMLDTKLGTVTNTTYTVENLSAGQTYNFIIYALNAAGIVSSPSATFAASTLSPVAPQSVTMTVYGVYSSGNGTVTSNVYALSADGSGVYDNSAYPDNNYLVVQFSDSLATDQVNGTLNFSGATVSGLAGVSTSVYNSVYLVVYSPTGFPALTTTNLSIIGITKTVSSQTYSVDPVTVKVLE